MRDDERDHATDEGVQGTPAEPAEPAEPAKVHGDVLEELIPRDQRAPAPREEDGGATRTRREGSTGGG